MGSVAGHPPQLLLPLPLPLKPLDSRSFKDSGSAQSPSLKQRRMYPQRLPRWTCLAVPVVDTEMEARPLTLEEMEDVSKRYRERKRQNRVPLPLRRGEGRGWGPGRKLGPPTPVPHLLAGSHRGSPASSLPLLCV